MFITHISADDVWNYIQKNKHDLEERIDTIAEIHILDEVVVEVCVTVESGDPVITVGGDDYDERFVVTDEITCRDTILDLYENLGESDATFTSEMVAEREYEIYELTNKFVKGMTGSELEPDIANEIIDDFCEILYTYGLEPDRPQIIYDKDGNTTLVEDYVPEGWEGAEVEE